MKKFKQIVMGLACVYALALLSVALLQSKMIFQAEKLEQNFRYEFSYPFKELNLQASDGASLNALYFTTPKPRGVILYFHGNKGSLKRWGEIAGKLTRFGFNVLVMDYRTYGKSSGQLNAIAMENDARLFYQQALKYFPEDSIVVYGRSLGTHFATVVASENNPRQLILETPFTSITDVAKSKLFMFPVKRLIKYPFDNIKNIGQLKCPLTIFHGTQDNVVPYRLGKQLFESAGTTEKELITIQKGSHNNLSNFSEYQKGIKKVLDR
ncbi:MAG TPA: alpha/beta fold hydrolase [Niabella sp.]|nr:alpha/beta fold hydrolase [Niabella sp.]HOZ96140.1 alpha/beta fold hydrolase [Niabella sp.]HQW13506.1 alpha/beta fold hydrolase [Niabella sp.]HQX18900.1 alpha/beta fold hydrolase [Niabella sp.]HQX41812.1 alpha/beta fold hydrolase [Niabella sp.]